MIAEVDPLAFGNVFDAAIPSCEPFVPVDQTPTAEDDTSLTKDEQKPSLSDEVHSDATVPDSNLYAVLNKTLTADDNALDYQASTG